MDRERQKQVRILSQLVAGEITTGEAAASLGVSVRWVERKRPAFRERGAAALVHGNTGRPPANKIPTEKRALVQNLARNKFRGFNFQHMTERVVVDEGIALSPRSMHRICREDDITPPRTQKRRSKHRKRRERRSQEGAMLQLDGSPHDWLEGRGPRMTLINFHDDATNKKWREFRLGEDLEGYMRVMHRVVAKHGVPVSVYTDRTVIVAGASRKYKAMPDEPAGPSQFGRALAELGVAVILANSAQAKGRVERGHGTDQDRLTSELRLAHACTLHEANTVLRWYDKKHGSRFTIPATDPKPAWKPRPTTNLSDIFCIKEERKVAKDNTVRYCKQIIDIPPGPHKRSYAGSRVLVHRRYDGTVGVYLGDKRIGGDPPRPTGSLRSVPEPVQANQSTRSIEKRAVQIVQEAINELGMTFAPSAPPTKSLPS